MSTCWGIVGGEYPDCKILAIFSTEEKARDQLEAWGGDDVEEFPFDDFQPKPPRGMTAYNVSRWKKKIKAYPTRSTMYLREFGDAVTNGGVSTHLWARNEEHAIKIAAERFAQYDAREAGIA